MTDSHADRLTDGHILRHAHRRTHTQTGWQMDTYSNRLTNGHTRTQADRQTHTQTGWQTRTQTGWQTHTRRQADRQTHTQIGWQTGTHRDRMTDRHTRRQATDGHTRRHLCFITTDIWKVNFVTPKTSQNQERTSISSLGLKRRSGDRVISNLPLSNSIYAGTHQCSRPITPFYFPWKTKQITSPSFDLVT